MMVCIQEVLVYTKHSLQLSPQIQWVLNLLNIFAFQDFHIEKSQLYLLFEITYMFLGHLKECCRYRYPSCACILLILLCLLSKSKFLDQENPFLEAQHFQLLNYHIVLQLNLSLWRLQLGQILLSRQV